MTRQPSTLRTSNDAAEATIDWRNSVLIGIGNDGRNDDGLGWAFVDAMEQDGRFPGRLARRFQLQIEDAELISHFRHVIFVDAFRNSLPNGFQWQNCLPQAFTEFSSHRLSPQSVLDLCHQLYTDVPTAHLLLIAGNHWELSIGLSRAAESNLQRSLHFFRELVYGT